MSEIQSGLGKRRLVTHIIDQIAAEDPSRPWISVPRTSDPGDGWRDITYGQFANAINIVAHEYIKEFGTPVPNTFPTIAYIGPNDARYFVYSIAAVKAGYQNLLISPRNSEQGQLSLFEATDCNAIYYTSTYKAAIQPWLQKREMWVVEIRNIHGLLDDLEQAEAFPYNKTFDEAEWDPLVVMHTSGSTGIPKPIIIRQGTVATCDTFRELPKFHGLDVWTNAFSRISTKCYIPMPLFHGAGFAGCVMFGIYGGVQIALGVTDRPLSSTLVIESLAHCGADSTLLSPSILEELSRMNNAIDLLGKLKMVVFGGGNLGKEAGDKLVSSGVNLGSFISTTECLPYLIYLDKDPANWQYFVYNDDLFGCEWRPTTSEDDVFQLVIVRKGKEPGLQPCFYTFPEDNEYDTKDLFKRHPTLPNRWKFHGRSDSIIVFSNAEKLNPVTIEEIVTSHPDIKGAVVFGQGHFQPGLLIEPVENLENHEQASKLLNSVWAKIKEANEVTVAHGRVSRQFVIFTNPEKPLPRAGKGSIQRAGALKLYKNEIDKLYAHTEGDLSIDDVKLDISSENALAKCIVALFRFSLGIANIDDSNTNIFSAGMDSLQVMDGSRMLRSGLQAAGLKPELAAVANRDIYDNPTAHKLAVHIFSRFSNPDQGEQLNKDSDERQNDIADALVVKYTNEMPISASGKPQPAATGQTIMITGSTGSLGSYMLDIVLESLSIGKVICLNRGDDGGRQRQAKISAERGLRTDFTKVEFYSADLSRYNLGLKTSVYADLLSKVDRIIHNSWSVNFNIDVETFEPHIHGVRNIVEFASRCSKQVPIVFLSSIGSVMKWNKDGPIPETSLPDFAITEGGYGRAKLAASMILEKASQISGISAASIRVGQIAGPLGEKGEWNRQEWLPSLIFSSAHIGALPESLGPMSSVSWMPVETVAQAVLELSGAISSIPLSDITGYFHCVNPTKATWQELLPAILEFFKSRDCKLEVVRLADWIHRVEQEKDVSKNPATKLLETYQGWLTAEKAGQTEVELSVERTKTYSKAIREMKAISPELMSHWCQQWYR
ncbi:hypothetical protein F5884DRAFT_683230 [Xylogone sp. PMI_703]|nr:hypothetical protein F5884DRAFT_683230 [Xylogone sp. PMI_703]